MEENILNRLNELQGFLEKQEILQKEVLSLPEAARYLDISKSYLYKLTSKREIPFYCPQGKRLYFKRCELDHWLTRNRTSTILELHAKASDLLVHTKSKSYE